MAFAWRMRQASPASAELVALTISFLLAVTTITLLPGHAVYDHVVLLPGVILIALSWRGFAASSHLFRVVLGAAALALFWQWIVAPVVIAMRPILFLDYFFRMCSRFPYARLARFLLPCSPCSL
jgi:hypothetical protein